MGDFVSLVEQAYSLHGTAEEWLLGVLQRARPMLDRGLGVFGYYFDVAGSPPAMRIQSPLGLGVAPDMLEHAAQLIQSVPAELLDRTFRSATVCATTSEATGLGKRLAHHPTWRELAHPIGLRDAIGIKAMGAAPFQGVMVHAPLDRVTRLTRRVREAWERAAAHLSAGLRLRAALGEGPVSVLQGAEAVLDRRGRLAHAEAPATSRRARHALQAAVTRMERARGALRSRDPEAALKLWLGLVAGRWSLVDHFDVDGRRFLVARRNDPAVTDPRSLTLRERQVLLFAGLGHTDKLIAYELGIGTSTVSTLVARIKAKLGVTSRVQLIALVQSVSVPSCRPNGTVPGSRE